jgi:D-beta-D-heptose 7-phosphate kinase/D-beta-D-heptose 1-phosphate adenosyltransferase
MKLDPVALSHLVDRLAGRRAVVIGDVMLDRYVIGTVARISPEAPIPILRVTSESARPGGAGNVARNLAALGLKVDLIGAVGNDQAADELASALAAERQVALHLARDRQRRTTTKTRHIAGGQQLLRADREEVHPVSGAVEQRLVDAAVKAVARAGAVVLSDYGKGSLTEVVIQAAIAAAAKNNIPIVVDPFGRDWRRYRGATLLKPNRAEVTEATGVAPSSDASALEAARAARRLAGTKAVLLSRAEAGLTLVAGRQELHLPAEAREVADVTGAGDSVVATVAAALAAGGGFTEAAALAGFAGGIAVGHVGAYAVTATELKATLRADAARAANAKVAGRDEAARRVADWREAGARIGFTNGVFDLLHPGHVSLIAEAKRQCDKLVVAINADASVKRLKGPDRPIQDENARAMVLAALGDVDLVVVFEEDTPIPLLKLLKPDVLVKGGDYTRDQVVGAGLVEGWGGVVRLARVVPGHSTSATVRRLQR